MKLEIKDPLYIVLFINYERISTLATNPTISLSLTKCTVSLMTPKIANLSSLTIDLSIHLCYV